ncbi:hypothetical protein J6590_057544, partial [Homalodisca vitripennis]
AVCSLTMIARVTDRVMSSQVEETNNHNPVPGTSCDFPLMENSQSSDDPQGSQSSNKPTIDPNVPGPSTPQPVNVKRPTTLTLTPEDVMPYPKYVPKGKERRGRKKGRSRILTDTPEKDALVAELKEKEHKKMLVEKRKQERAVKKENDSSSNEDEIQIKLDDGGLSPEDFSEDEEELFDYLPDKNYATNDFILTKFASKKAIYHFIGQIEEHVTDGFSVKFLKKNQNSYKFYFPENVEVSFVETKDIEFKLRQPDIIGGTSRAANCFVFKENLTTFNFK